MSINFEKRQQRYDLEALTLEKLRAERKVKLHKDYDYEEYAAPIVKTYDTILDGTLSILRHATLDERGARIRVANEEKEKVCANIYIAANLIIYCSYMPYCFSQMDKKNARGGKGLTFALKPENQVNLELFE